MKIRLFHLLSIMSMLSGSVLYAKNEVRMRNETAHQLHWHIKTTGKDQNGEIDPKKEHTFKTDAFLEKLTITFWPKDSNGKPILDSKGQEIKTVKSYDFKWNKAASDWNIAITGNPVTEWKIEPQEHKLYEVFIGNDTKEKMHWHIKTTGKDNNGDINPGAAKYFYTNDLLQALTITFRKSTGRQEEIKYSIPGLESGKDWMFAISGTPFQGKWKVCGWWAHTKLQHEATLGAEITAIALGMAAATIATGGVAGEVAASQWAAWAVPLSYTEIAAGVSTAAPALTVGAAQTAGAAAGAVTAGTAVGTGVAAAGKSVKNAFGLSRKMNKDKCKYFGK